MDLTHIHLLLNHVPTIGFGMGLFLFVWALLANSPEMKRAGLVLFVGVAILTMPQRPPGVPSRPLRWRSRVRWIEATSNGGSSPKRGWRGGRNDAGDADPSRYGSDTAPP